MYFHFSANKIAVWPVEHLKPGRPSQSVFREGLRDGESISVSRGTEGRGGADLDYNFIPPWYGIEHGTISVRDARKAIA